MSRIRKWYVYNGTAGGQHNHLNYFFIDPNYLPNACLMVADNICAVKAIYSESNFGLPPIIYGTNSKNFVLDPKLSFYIDVALASGTRTPASGQKTYVYVRDFFD